MSTGNDGHDGPAGEPSDRQQRLGVDPLWSSALRALRGQPTTALAVVLAVAVAASVAAAAPLFTSSVGNEAFRQRSVAADPVDAGITITMRRAEPAPGALERFEAQLHEHLPIGAGLQPPTLTIDGQGDRLETRVFRAAAGTAADEQRRLETADPPAFDEGRRAVKLFAQEGITDHLDVVWSTGTSGLWVPDVVADQIGLAEGDELLYTVAMSAEGRTIGQVPVAGVYRDIWADGLTERWRQVPEPMLTNPPSPVVPETQRQMMLIGEPELVLQVAAELGEAVRYIWQAPIGEVPTLPEARQLAQVHERFDDALVATGRPLRDTWTQLSATGRAPTTTSDLAALIGEAEAGRDAVDPLLRSLSIAGVALSLGVIAVTGAFVTRRRASQVGLLWSQGVGPWAHATRTGLELLPVVVAGGLLGWLAALAAVRTQGPWGALEPVWVARAAWSALVTAAVGLVTLVLVAATSARSIAGTAPSDRRRSRQVALGGIAVATLASGLAIRTGETADATTPLVQAFPLLVVASAGALATALVAVVLMRWSGSLRPVWADLALQRLRTSAASAGPLVMATAVAVGLVVYATGLASSITTSTREKAVAQAGANSVVQVRESFGEVAVVPNGAQLVARGGARSATTGGAATVLVVDAAALADAAPWGEGFSSVDLDEVLAAITDEAASGPGSAAPLAAAGPGARPVGSNVELTGRGSSIVGQVVRHVDALPGMSSSGPTYLVDRDAFAAPEQDETPEAALERQLRNYRTLLWSASDPDALVRAATTAGLDPQEVVSVADRLADPRLLAQVGATDFVRLLGGIATLVAVGALALYGGSRQRERFLSYALSRRMGLTVAAHRHALLGELAALLLLAGLVGLPAALVGLVAVLPVLDPLPGVGPPMAITLPLTGSAVVAGTLLLVGAAYALLLQRQAESADVAEVLRVSD